MCFLCWHMGVCYCSLLPINTSGNTHADFDVVDVFCVCQFGNFIPELWNSVPTSAKMSWMLLWSGSWGTVALYLSYIHYMLYRKRDEQYYLKHKPALCIPFWKTFYMHYIYVYYVVAHVEIYTYSYVLLFYVLVYEISEKISHLQWYKTEKIHLEVWKCLATLFEEWLGGGIEYQNSCILLFGQLTNRLIYWSFQLQCAYSIHFPQNENSTLIHSSISNSSTWKPHCDHLPPCSAAGYFLIRLLTCKDGGSRRGRWRTTWIQGLMIIMTTATLPNMQLRVTDLTR